MSTPIAQQKAASKSANEFDTGDDDELANFDLDAAISSATKQSPPNKDHGTKQALPPQYPMSNYKSSTQDATCSKDSGDLRKELENLRREKDRFNREVGLVKQEAEHIRQENERMTKETDEAKEEKARLKGQIRAIREEHEMLQSDLNTAKQRRDEKHEAEIEELHVERSKLKGQIRALQEQRNELKSDVKSAVQKNEDATKEKYEKELKELGTEKSKLKGQIRALQEQYDQLKIDVQSATQKKDCAEKESRAALVKKEEYEKEAKTVKKALESHRVELDGLAKKQDAASKATLGESQPPTKKQKIGKQVKVGTIVKSMKVAELKEEAVARGIDVKELTRINKDSLLEMLVVGSPCIIKTDAWDEVVSLRKTFAEERQKAEQLERKRQEEIYRKKEQKWREQEKKRQEQRDKDRAEEISKQGEFHSLSVPKKVHGCKLAFTKDLLFHGTPRSYNTQCTECGSRFNIEYTCEGCDYDICNECFKQKTMTASEKKAAVPRLFYLLLTFKFSSVDKKT